MSSILTRIMQHFSGASRLSISGGSGGGAIATPADAQYATVAAGCFWGVEHVYRRHFSPTGGILDVKVGYTGGDVDNPNYRQVCGGQTGHAEAARIAFDPAKLTYRQLIEFFYRMHDPTTANSQGPDRGPQYRSAIFFNDPEQERVAREVTDEANAKWLDGKIVTEILPAGRWYDAEEYHQLYLDKNPSGYECPTHFVRTFPPLRDEE